MNPWLTIFVWLTVDFQVSPPEISKAFTNVSSLPGGVKTEFSTDSIFQKAQPVQGSKLATFTNNRVSFLANFVLGGLPASLCWYSFCSTRLSPRHVSHENVFVHPKLSSFSQFGTYLLARFVLKIQFLLTNSRSWFSAEIAEKKPPHVWGGVRTRLLFWWMRTLFTTCPTASAFGS